MACTCSSSQPGPPSDVHFLPQPWYAKLPEAEPEADPGSVQPAAQQPPAPRQPLLALPEAHTDVKRKAKHKGKDKEKGKSKKHKHGKEGGGVAKHRADSGELAKQLALAQLRAEREAREAAEQGRQGALLRAEAAKARADGHSRCVQGVLAPGPARAGRCAWSDLWAGCRPKPGQRYHSSYGSRQR